MKLSIKDFDSKMDELQVKKAMFEKAGRKVKPVIASAQIITIYLIMGFLWILLSDKILNILVKDTSLNRAIQTYKGWFYVTITGLVFFSIILNRMRLFKVAIDSVNEGYEELSSTTEELIAIEEELRSKYDEVTEQKDALFITDQRYHLAIDGSNDGIWDFDCQSGKGIFSITQKPLFSEGHEEIGHLDQYFQLIHSDDRGLTKAYLDDYLANKKEPFQCKYRLVTSNGDYRWIQSKGKAIWNEDGMPIRMAGSHTDVTESMELQERLRTENELLENIFETSPIMMLIVDRQEKILQINPFALKCLGYSTSEMIGKKASDLLVSKQYRGWLNNWFLKILNGEEDSFKEVELMRKNGSPLDVLWKINLLHDGNKQAGNLVAIGVDITTIKQTEDKLHHLAYYDLLTDLPNRQLIMEMGEEFIFQNKSQPHKSSMAALFIDVDGFKYVNTTMGNEVGNQILRRIGRELGKLANNSPYVGRVGGDEFIILMPDIKLLDNATELASKIVQHFRQSYLVDDQEVVLTVSIGCAFYPLDGDNIEEVLKCADTALHMAKEQGKDQYLSYTKDMMESTKKFIQLSNQLRNAINNNEMTLYYQPKVDINTEKIVGAEALIRWIHPTEGFMPPIDFIPFAEKTGMIIRIDEWVIHQACRQLIIWREKGIMNPSIAVNLSAKILSTENLLERFKGIVDFYGVDYSNLEIEITETAVIADLNETILILTEMRKLGVKVALDDFGTGYSSLTYLEKLPLDVLKIDREFVNRVKDRNEESFILNTAIELAHNLNLLVVAEGVETEEQLALLKRYGCDIVQGYYYYKPMVIEAFEGLVVEVVARQ